MTGSGGGEKVNVIRARAGRGRIRENAERKTSQEADLGINDNIANY
jgi:hypothetical protein